MIGTLPYGLTRGGATPFSPSDIPGLKLWLRADVGVTGVSPVTNWADQSGNGNDATPSTGTVTLNPSIGGYPACVFASSSLEGALAVVAPGSARTTYIVLGTNAFGGATVCFAKSSDVHCLLSSFGGAFAYTSLSGPNAAWAGAPPSPANTIWRYRYDGSGLLAGMTLSISGVPQALTGGGTVPSETGTAGYVLGRCPVAGLEIANGPIYEVIVYDTALSVPNDALVSAYLLAQYSGF